MFFTEVAQIVPVSEVLISQAHHEAQSVGLGALDALHIATAKISGAEELVTTERLTTALCRGAGPMIPWKVNAAMVKSGAVVCYNWAWKHKPDEVCRQRGVTL